MRTETSGAGAARTEAILGALALAVKRLSTAVSWDAAAPEVLAGLGLAAGATCVAILENATLKGGGLSLREHSRWVAPEPQEPTRPAHAGQPRGSIFVPVLVGERWWGFVRLDAGRRRVWSPVEAEALRAAAGILGAAIFRDTVDGERRRAEAWLRSHVENIPAVTYIEYTDPDHPLGYAEAYVSPQITTLFGYTQDEWLHDEDLSLWARIIHPEDRAAVDELAARTSATGDPYAAEYRMRTKNGRWLWVRDEAHLVQGEGDVAPYWHGVIVDITARKRAEEQVAFLAYHDHLTGLANRALFEEMLEPALARARRADLAVVVLFMDLDDFKQVNDALGHEMGDVLLKQVAGRLTEVTRETDLVARQGGDEFLVMMPDIDPGAADGEGVPGPDRVVDVAELMAERIHGVMRAPFALGDHTVDSSASIGASVFPLDAHDARGLLKNSDAAMYERKKARRSRRVA
jgi:diguanylate cyclase (GGDEF)-like protein/PAS domain S-box-containing protein